MGPKEGYDIFYGGDVGIGEAMQTPALNLTTLALLGIQLMPVSADLA